MKGRARSSRYLGSRAIGAPLTESVLLRERQTALCMALRNSWLAAQGVKNRRIITSVCVRVRMFDAVGPLKGCSHLRDCRVDVAKEPESPRPQRQVRHSCILASRASAQAVRFVACVERLNGVLDRFAGIGKTPHKKENHRLPA